MSRREAQSMAAGRPWLTPPGNFVAERVLDVLPAARATRTTQAGEPGVADGQVGARGPSPLPITLDPWRRCFLALRPSHHALRSLDRQRSHWQWPHGTRALEGADLHLTVHFLGDVLPERQAALYEALDALSFDPLPVVIRGPAVWRDVAVLTGEAGARMLHLHAAAGKALAAAGFAIQARAWRPHVTLARKAAAARWPAEVEPIRWTAKALHLGCRADEGPLRYRWLREWTAIGGA